jgi:MFS transporter, OFA family, oxalate/formate antiporter
MDFEIKPDT